jgi:hypothetical protein|tara:strand:+ start:1412 stop:2353 length:942 start_codon:yes stop_codon:yes gene_type:complete
MSKLQHNQQPGWREFEIAVAQFLQTLDPASRVIHDLKQPDGDTGHFRQRDVWIETQFGGHIPIKILVSCKRKKAKLSQQDVDAFRGELLSSNAGMGVLYSFSGFTKPALEKADRLGISCCRLYFEQAPDLPSVLNFQALYCREQHRLRCIGGGIPSACGMADLMATRLDLNEAERTVAEHLVERYNRERPDLSKLGTAVPDDWSVSLNLENFRGNGSVKVGLDGSFRIFKASFDAWLVSGSYSFANEDFKGSFSTPYIDRFSDHPGPGWQEISRDEVACSINQMNMIAFGGVTANTIQTYADNLDSRHRNSPS